jgi:hypothetical protein
MNEEFDSAVRALRERVGAEPVVLDWSPDELRALLVGTLVQVESETRQDRDGHDYTVHALVIDDSDDGSRMRVKVEGRSMKAWFGANRDLIKPGVLLAVRFDGTRESSTAEWREYTIKPDSRSGDGFTVAPGAGDVPPF